MVGSTAAHRDRLPGDLAAQRQPGRGGSSAGSVHHQPYRREPSCKNVPQQGHNLYVPVNNMGSWQAASMIRTHQIASHAEAIERDTVASTCCTTITRAAAHDQPVLGDAAGGREGAWMPRHRAVEHRPARSPLASVTARATDGYDCTPRLAIAGFARPPPDKVPRSSDRRGATQGSTTVEAADWIAAALAPFEHGLVASVVRGASRLCPAAEPGPAYLRRGTSRVRWSEIARWSGVPLHPDSRFHSIALPPQQPAGPPPWNGQGPERGSLDLAYAEALIDLLRPYTPTPDDCPFSMWDRWGWDTAIYVALPGEPPIPLPDPVPPEVRYRPRVRLPGRDYLLYAGPVAVTAVAQLARQARRRICGGPPTAPGAWRPRSICHGPMSAVRPS